MDELAVIALLGLATLGVTNLAVEVIGGLARYRTVAAFTVALAGVVVLDHSLFAGFDVAVADDTTAVVVTGLVVGSLAGAWRAVLAWFDRSPAAGEGDAPRSRARLAA